MSNNYIRHAFIAFVFILTVFLIISISSKRTMGDFDVYYLSSQHYLAKAPVYVAHDGIDEFKYSPLFALFFSPLTLISKDAALYVWNILNIILLYAIFYILYKLKQMSFTSVRDFLIIICLFALTGRYIFSNLKLGQVNVLMCWLMVLAMYLEMNKKYFWASVTLAFSLMIKFFPLLFVAYFILKKRFRLAGLTVLMVAFLLLLPSIYTGFDLNLKYLHDWLALLKSTPSHLLCSVRNNSFLAFYTWLFIVRHEPYGVIDYNMIKTPLTPEVYYFWAASCLILFGVFFKDTLMMKNKDNQTSFWDYSCLFLCGLLFNPLAYLNAMVFLIVPYFFILRHLYYGQMNRRSFIVLASLIFFSLFLNIVDQKLLFPDISQFYLLVQLKPLMWAMLLVYMGLWLGKFSEWGKGTINGTDKNSTKPF